MIRAIQGTSSISFWGELGNWNILRISLTHIALSGFSRLPLSLSQILPLFFCHLSFLQGVTNRAGLHWCFVYLAPFLPLLDLCTLQETTPRKPTHKQKVKIQPRSRLNIYAGVHQSPKFGDFLAFLFCLTWLFPLTRSNLGSHDEVTNTRALKKVEEKRRIC